MEVSRQLVRTAIFIFGPLILASYAIGISRMPDPVALWGGIPESLRPFNVTCMFIAAAGFLIMWWMFLYQWDIESVESLNWPWTDGDGGHTRLLISFLLVMIPSMLWLEMTRYHILNPAPWTPIAVISILALVAIGNFLLGLLAWDAFQNQISEWAWLPFVGALMLAIQVIINDALWWSIVFPWK